MIRVWTEFDRVGGQDSVSHHDDITISEVADRFQGHEASLPVESSQDKAAS